MNIAAIADLRRLLEPGVDSLGLDLLDIELVGSGGNRTLRVYIDAPGGITVEDCARASRQISAVLDVEDPVPGSYHLEVSSPGLDRPLVKRAHFEQVVGNEVRVQLAEYLEGRRRFRGRLLRVDESTIEVEVDGEVFTLSLDAIEKARLVSGERP